MGDITATFELDGTQATPENGRALGIVQDFRGDRQENRVSLTTLNFALEHAKKLRDAVAGGMTGNVGIFEGIPFQIKINQDAITETVFDGYVDLTNEGKFIGCNEVEANLLEKQGVDWLNEVADSFSFAYLASSDGGNIISSADYVDCNYVLGYRPQAFAVAIISISVYMTTKELIESVKASALAIADFVEAFGKLNPLGELLSAGLKAVAQVVYSTAIAFALVVLIKDLIQELFPPVRTHKGMKLKTLFQKGCQHLGLTFSSTIFDLPIWKDLVIMPQATEKENKIGHPNANSPVYTFGDLIRFAKDMFNAEYEISGGVFTFERKIHWQNTSSYVIDNVYVNQDLKVDEYSYNTDEIFSNYLISYQTDTQDKNTLEAFQGTNYQVITSPLTTINPDAVVIKNLAEIRIPFARATRKDGLTKVEELMKALCQSVDSVVNTLGSSSDLAGKIKNRVGMLNLSDDTTTVDKLMVLSGGKLPNNLSNDATAKNIWEYFHFSNSFVPLTDPLSGDKYHNQNIIRTGVVVPFCPKDYLVLKSNNFLTTNDNKKGEIIENDWQVFQGTATLTYKINEQYTKNLKLSYNEGK